MGLLGPRRLPGASASISSLPAAGGTILGFWGAGWGAVEADTGGLLCLPEPPDRERSDFRGPDSGDGREAGMGALDRATSSEAQAKRGPSPRALTGFF